MVAPVLYLHSEHITNTGRFTLTEITVRIDVFFVPAEIKRNHGLVGARTYNTVITIK